MLTNFIKGIFKICTCVFYKLFWDEEQKEEFPDDEGILSLLGKIISPFLLFYFIYNYSISNASRYRRRRSRRFQQQLEPEFTDSDDGDSIASELNRQYSPEMNDTMTHYESNNQDRISYATMPDFREKSESYTRSECNFATDNNIEFRFNNIENFNRTDSQLGYSKSYDNLTPPVNDTNSRANSVHRSNNLFTVNEEAEKSDDSGEIISRTHSRSFRKRLTKHTLTTKENEIKKTRTGTAYGRKHYL